MIKARCPICDRWMHGQGPKEWPQWPFCSPRCKLIDLGRWLGGAYRLESPPGPNDEDADHADPGEPIPDEDLSDADVTWPPKPAVPSAAPNREEA